MISDLRIALRGLRKNPAFTAIAVLTLALGIGANTAMFSVVNAVLLRPLSGDHTERLMFIQDTLRGSGIGLLAPRVFEELRKQTRSFEGIAGHNFRMLNFTGSGDPEQLAGPSVTANWFEVMHAHALLGRTFLPDEDQPGHDRVVVLDHAFWKRRFQGDRNIIGQKIVLNKAPWLVIGVMPPDFEFMGSAMIYTPHVLVKDRDTALWVTARLKDSVSVKTALAELRTVNSRIASASSDYKDIRLKCTSMLEAMTGPQQPLLLILLGAAGFVLLIACVNVANLLLVRGTARRHEIDIRLALGAPRSRILRLVLGEAALLALFAAISALGVAWAVLRIFRPLLSELPRSENTSIDSSVLLWTLGIAALSTFLFGFLPALRSTPSSGIAGMRVRSTSRWQGGLLAGEVALAFVLVCGAGLLIRSFVGLRTADLGYDPANVLTNFITLDKSKDGSRHSGLRLYQRIRDKVAAVPGVTGVATTTSLPMGGLTMTMDVEKENEPARKHDHQALMNIVSPGYFRVARIPFRAGRDFGPNDREGASPVVIVSESVSKRYFNGAPIGKRMKVPEIKFNLTGDKESMAEIVGVVKDVIVNSVGEAGAEHLYLAEAQFGVLMSYLVVRTEVDPMTVARDIRRAVYEESPETPLDESRTLSSRAAQIVDAPKNFMWILSAFAALALGLAAVGIYGVSAYLAAQRRKEIGLRIALGAARADIVQLVYRNSLGAALTGLAAGLLAALALTHFLDKLLYRVDATDPATLVLSGATLALVALLATTGPAVRATRTDPAVVLRDE